MDFQRCDCCVSDADVMVKFSRSGRLDLLNRVMPALTIPKWVVRREILRKIGTRGPLQRFLDAVNSGWIRVVDTDGGEDLSAGHLRGIRVFIESYQSFMDDGELRTAALATEIGIPIMLSDDRDAQRVIQSRTDLQVLRVHEVVTLGVIKGVATETEAEEALEAIKRLQTHPSTVPVTELIARARIRLAKPF